jgi:hypothetical protein
VASVKTQFINDVLGLPSDVYDVLLTKAKYAGWVCQDCRYANKSRLSNVQSALAHTNDVLTDVRVLLDHLQNELKSIKENRTSDSPNSASSAAQIALTGDIISSQTHAAASDVRSKTAISEVTLEIHRTINEIAFYNSRRRQLDEQRPQKTNRKPETVC